MITKVPQGEKSRRSDALASACRTDRLPLTAARRAIFTYLAGTTSHPTAQQIFQELRPLHPSLSLATVYNNLETFARLGIAKKIITHDGQAHWDADMRPHHHAIHLGTDEIHDIHDEINIPLPRTLAKKNLAAISVNFYIQ